MAAEELEEERDQEVGEVKDEEEGEGVESKLEGAEPPLPADSNSDQPATDTKMTGSVDNHDSASKDSTPKDPCPPVPAPAEGFLQGLMEVHTNPPLPPLVGVE